MVRLPTLHQLRAAARVVMLVDGQKDLHSALLTSYRSVASGGMLSSDQLENAERWLVDVGVLSQDGETVRFSMPLGNLSNGEFAIMRELLSIWILQHPPVWVGSAVFDGEVRPELLPAQIVEILDPLFESDERDALILASFGKYDAERLKALGDLGEMAVEAACKQFHLDLGNFDFSDRVYRASLVSDSFGYDVVSPNSLGEDCFLEVKCFSGPEARFFITRNEYEVGRRLGNWFLVVCRAVSREAAIVVGWTTALDLEGEMPRDVADVAQWQVVKRVCDTEALVPGLPL